MILNLFFHKGWGWHEDLLKTLQRNTVEFLQEETCNLPANAEIDVFYQKIEQLECNVTSLTEKIKHLEQGKQP